MSFTMQSTTSGTVAAPSQARPRSTAINSPPVHCEPILFVSLVPAVAIAESTSGSVVQSAGAPVWARRSRHRDCALYRDSKYLRAPTAMASWHCCVAENAPSTSVAELVTATMLPINTMVLDLMDVPPG